MDFNPRKLVLDAVANKSQTQEGSSFLINALRSNDTPGTFKSIIYEAAISYIVTFMSHEQSCKVTCEIIDSLSAYNMHSIVKTLATEPETIVPIVTTDSGAILFIKLIEKEGVNKMGLWRCVTSQLAREFASILRSESALKVVKVCFSNFNDFVNKNLVEAVTDFHYELSTSCFGHTVMTEAIERIQNPEELINLIASKALVLSQHTYGGRVIQHIMRNSEKVDLVLKELKGSIVKLSQHKYACFVVRKALEKNKTAIHIAMEELMDCESLQEIACNQWGHFILRTILRDARENEHFDNILHKIWKDESILKESIYGDIVRTKCVRAMHWQKMKLQKK